MAEAAIAGINKYAARGHGWNPQLHPASLDSVPQISLSHKSLVWTKYYGASLNSSTEKQEGEEGISSHHLCLLGTSATIQVAQQWLFLVSVQLAAQN